MKNRNLKNSNIYFLSNDYALQMSFLFLVLIAILFAVYIYKSYLFGTPCPFGKICPLGKICPFGKSCPLGKSCSYGSNCPHKNLVFDEECKGKSCYKRN